MAGDFCEYGCYWDCDHRRRRPSARRPIAGLRNADPAALWDYYLAADDQRYCRERFVDAVGHAKEHLRRRRDAASERRSATVPPAPTKGG